MNLKQRFTNGFQRVLDNLNKPVTQLDLLLILIIATMVSEIMK